MPKVSQDKLRRCAMLLFQGEHFSQAAMKSECVKHPSNVTEFKRNNPIIFEFLDELREREADTVIKCRNDKLRDAALISDKATKILNIALDKFLDDKDLIEAMKPSELMKIANLSHKVSNEIGKRDDRLQGHEKEPEQNDKNLLQEALLEALKKPKQAEAIDV